MPIKTAALCRDRCMHEDTILIFPQASMIRKILSFSSDDMRGGVFKKESDSSLVFTKPRALLLLLFLKA